MTDPIDDITVINILYGKRDGAFTVNMKKVSRAKTALNKLLLEARLAEAHIWAGAHELAQSSRKEEYEVGEFVINNRMAELESFKEKL